MVKLMMYGLTCYGEEYAHVNELGIAKEISVFHIQTCPLGAMLWAVDIEWHITTEGTLCSAANGEWLDHHILVRKNES